MKRNFLLSAIAMGLLVMCMSFSTKAQTNHVFHVATFYMAGNMDSAARAESVATFKEYMTKVTMKNQYIVHQTNMVHFFTEDSREFVIVTEYANWGDIEKSFDLDNELEKQAWPDAAKRAAFMKKMSSYFTHHKDAIFSGLPGLTK
ncbi:MAG: hypothetical protein V4556_13695 [Bacteroidota bacterium]